MHRGFVKFYRKAYFDGWLNNRNLWTFWSYVLLTAEHFQVVKMVGSQRVLINRGQKLFFRRRAASDLNFTEREIRTCLKALEKTETVTIKATNKYSIITIINFESYASGEDENDQQNANKVTNNRSGKRHASDQQTTHNKEIQELKEEIRRLKNTPPTPQGGDGKKPREICPYQKIVDTYHEKLPALPKVDLKDPISEPLKRRIRSQWKKHGLDTILSYLERCSHKPFLLGDNNGDWKASLMWLLKPENMVKVNESGSYGEDSGSADITPERRAEIRRELYGDTADIV